MPVLSESIASSGIPGLQSTYVWFLGAGLLLLIGVLISRKSKSTKRNMSTPVPEKSTLRPQESIYSPPMNFPQHHHPTVMARPPQALPFTPPTLSTTIFPAPSSPSSPAPPSPGGLNQSYYDSPIDEFSSFPPPSPAILSTSTTTNVETELPRRRSYTRTTSGTEVTGEIITAEGWRRHTRVFGGGVCKACEESERRLSA
jgi:hypothetical protein